MHTRSLALGLVAGLTFCLAIDGMAMLSYTLLDLTSNWMDY